MIIVVKTQIFKIMNKLLVITILFLSFLSCESKRQYSGILPLKINKSITKEVNNNIESMYDTHVGLMDIKVYEDDVLLANDEKEKAKLLFLTSLRNDTISITGFSGFATALGFYLDLHGDNYTLSFMIHADSEIYRYTKDGDRHFTLSVPCSYTSCILTSKPTFSKGETVSGVVELKSEDFWQVLSNGKENKYHVELKAYFLAQENDFDENNFDIEKK